MEFREQIKCLIDKALQENPSLFLVDWSVNANNAIKIVLDGDKGVSVEDCVSVSRMVEHNLDRETQDFSLEVTSCGVFAPLVLERQYVKNIGRTLHVKTADIDLEGELKQVSEGYLLLQTQSREPKPVGKGKITVVKEHKIALETIKEAKLVIKF